MAGTPATLSKRDSDSGTRDTTKSGILGPGTLVGPKCDPTKTGKPARGTLKGP